MAALVQAIPVTAALTGRPVIVVGGLAVLCRLNQPYRSTSDLDTVHRRAGQEAHQLELLVDGGAAPSGPSGVLVETPAGPVQVDVLEVSDSDLTDLPDDPTDRLHVLSHAWAADTATAMVLRTGPVDAVTVRVAQPGALIATKLQSIMNRGRHKEATDCWTSSAHPRSSHRSSVARGLESADAQLRRAALLGPGRQIASVSFQQAPNNIVDDLVIVARDRGSRIELSIGIRGAPKLGSQ